MDCKVPASRQFESKKRSTKGSTKRSVVSLTVFISSKLSSVRSQGPKNLPPENVNRLVSVNGPVDIDTAINRRSTCWPSVLSNHLFNRSLAQDRNLELELILKRFFNRWRPPLIPPFESLLQLDFLWSTDFVTGPNLEQRQSLRKSWPPFTLALLTRPCPSPEPVRYWKLYDSVQLFPDVFGKKQVGSLYLDA